MTRLVISILACGLTYGQETNSSLRFEAVSIKASPAPGPDEVIRTGCHGGPGSTDPGLFVCTRANVTNFIQYAFHLLPYQLAIQWYPDDPTYEIAAKVPPGTTKEEFHVMLQNLVIDRFKLTFHYAKKEMPVRYLVVAKGGLKMKKSPPEPANTEVLADSATGPGKSSTPARSPYSMTLKNGHSTWTAKGATMGGIVSMLAAHLREPITDGTGLTGKYDLTLSWVAENSAETGPLLVDAIEEQLGLRLERRKGLADVFIIDHLEKAPVEN
jgi:uncharacterized protein (TIGR03435 family)